MQFDTRSIHTGYDCDEHNRAIMPPIYQNSMFALHHIGENIPYRYSRLNNPTRHALENVLAALEHGTAAFAYSSGMAGIDAVLRTFLRPNDTIVAVADIYGGAYDLLTTSYADWGVNVIFADLTNSNALDDILHQHAVKMIWLESPSNPLLRLVDITALAEKAHAAGALVAIDNTFATPYLQNPLNMGCDIVFHSATKYLCGHSDVMMGAVIVRDEQLAAALRQNSTNMGANAAPMDCALVLRGIKTLGIRMRQHEANATLIAPQLQNHPAIEKVFYPALPQHEHHELAKRQMRGFGGVISVYLKNNSRAAADQIIRRLQLFKMAASLGGVESLVNHSFTQSHSGMSAELKTQLGIREGLLRFSIGIEDAEDIWQDLKQALDSLL